MSDSWKHKIGDLRARLSEATAGAEGDVEVSAFIARVRETVGKTVSDVDAEAVVTHLRGAIGQVEGKIDAGKVREYVAGLDTEKLTGLLEEARTHAEPATRVITAQGERLTENMPGAVDKLLGAAKETLGELTGDHDLTRAGEMDQLRGQIKERFDAADAATEMPQATRDGEKERH